MNKKLVFLVSCAKDGKYTQAIARILRLAGYEVFDPHFDVDFGDSIRETIEKKLGEANLTVVLFSADFFAMKHSSGQTDPILSELWQLGDNYVGYMIRACPLPEIDNFIHMRFGNKLVAVEQIVSDIQSLG